MNSHKAKKFIMFLGDAALFAAALYLTLLFRYGQDGDGMFYAHLSVFLPIFIFFAIIAYILGLYNFGALVGKKFYANLVKALTSIGLIAIIFFYSAPLGIAPKRNLAIFLALYFVLFIIWRKFFIKFISANLLKTKIAIIASSTNAKQIKEVVEIINKSPHLGLEIAFIFMQSDDADSAEKISREAKSRGVKILAVDYLCRQDEKIQSELFACLPLKINITTLSDLYESITGKIMLEEINHAWFLENLSEGGKRAFDISKRIFDASAGAIALIFSLPLWPIIALTLKANNKESILFIQERAGYGGKKFRLIKFRTMAGDGENKKITRAGKFWRKIRFDEIPQLINIIRGEMSFVGPRPEQAGVAENFYETIPFYRQRELARPGLTGHDQTCGEYHSLSEEDTIKKLQYDLFYIKNRSLYLDLSIILKTIYAVLSGGGR